MNSPRLTKDEVMEFLPENARAIQPAPSAETRPTQEELGELVALLAAKKAATEDYNTRLRDIASGHLLDPAVLGKYVAALAQETTWRLSQQTTQLSFLFATEPT